MREPVRQTMDPVLHEARGIESGAPFPGLRSPESLLITRKSGRDASSSL